MSQNYKITVTVNGKIFEQSVEPRLLLSDFLRHTLSLNGTHVGCEQGVCGACTVLLEGVPIRSCLLFAVQVDGQNLVTVEGLSDGDGTEGNEMHPLQEAFWEAHGLQCGFCTPGFLMTLIPFLRENPSPSEEEIRDAISGNLCRCTGDQHIVDAVLLGAEKMKALEKGGVV